MRITRTRRRLALSAAMLAFSTALAADDSTAQDARIRAVVEEILRTKQAEIQALESRVRGLEARIEAQAATIQSLSNTAPPTQRPARAELDEANERIEALERRVAQAAEDREDASSPDDEGARGLEISGFFDMNALTENAEDKTFDFGDLELDLEYAIDAHFSVSSALVWSGEDAEVAVAVVDYHLFDDRVPARGRIFEEPGFHLQAGRFDVPFGVDYQYFAAPDRPNVTAPLTTERIQQGGFNGDGVRAYGTWENFDFAASWTESFYEDKGTTVAGRIGFFPDRNPFRFHRFAGGRDLEVGLSYAVDFDEDGDTRNHVYGADLTFNYGAFQLVAEAIGRDGLEDVIDGDGNSLGEPDQNAYYASLLADLSEWTDRPIYVFGRYERWDPDFDFVLDEDDDTVRFGVDATPRLTLGIGYDLSDYVRVKFEYVDYLGGGTDEPDFDDSLGIAQLTASF